MFERQISLIGEDNLAKIQKQTVALIGLGGVGGYALENLVRSGIQNLIIVDYDTIDLTNLNRQIITTQNNIGQKKVTEAQKRALTINPLLNIIPLDLYLNEENFEELFKYHIDYIIDACDSINTKKMLIKEASNRNIKLISCMGTGNKLDPSLLKITTIDKTSYDPLAKIIRKYIKDNQLSNKLPVVASTEPPIKTQSPHISSISYVPAYAGLLLTKYIIDDIIHTKE